MTLPFRRRHNDAEASHDRARILASDRLTEALTDGDEAWLAGHLEACVECRQAVETFSADREELRSLRDDAPTPPRDLWARTAAAIEQEASRAASRDRSAGVARRLGTAPLGALSGLVVVLVVVGASMLSQPRIQPPPPGTSSAPRSVVPEATPIAVAANGLNWITANDDGTFQLSVARVEQVCPTEDKGCAPLNDAVLATISLAQEPQSVVISPTSDQLVVVTDAANGSSVLVVPVTRPAPSAEPSTAPSAEPSNSPTPTGTPAVTTPPTPTPSPTPTATPPASSPATSQSPSSSPEPTPVGATEIATGVTVVGEPAYSADGMWFAFAARPADDSAGPDLYVWRVDDPHATRVTSDGRSVFAGWAGTYVLGSRVEAAAATEPEASLEPGATRTPTPTPSKTPEPTATPDAASPAPSPTPDVLPHLARTFLLDPVTGVTTDLAAPSVWRPAVDLRSARVVYWDGTLLADGKGGWKLGSGRLVLDTWNAPAAPTPSPSTDPSASPTTAPTVDPSASPEPTPRIAGPAGTSTILFDDATTIVDFDARFDPTGTRLAIWIADGTDPAIGRLRLFVIDPKTGAIDTELAPLPGVPALRGFSMERNRLAWVTPPGQDGEDSRISVLAWRGDLFGQTESDPKVQLKLVH